MYWETRVGPRWATMSGQLPNLLSDWTAAELMAAMDEVAQANLRAHGGELLSRKQARLFHRVLRLWKARR